MKKHFIVCACILAFIFTSLTGCSSPQDAYIGTWNLSSVEQTIDGSQKVVCSEEDVKSLNEANIYVYLNLRSNETLAIEDVSRVISGTWEVDGSAAKATLNDSISVGTWTYEDPTDLNASLSISNGTLRLDISNASFFFKKGEPRALLEVADDSGMVSDDGMSIIESETLDETISVADDEFVSISVDSIGVSSFLDPGFNLEIVNNSDHRITVAPADQVVINGKGYPAYLSIMLEPGTTSRAFLAVDSQDLGENTLDAIKGATVSLEVKSTDTDQVLGTYRFAL